ncbi:Gp49 family protein [Lysinibacillus capsici]|uniref:Gp49 family protein n=1 Tax=Lysinibacillus capsici TaxID=2115968 RepID=UPI0028969804|nr:Gp49 family protein [Lysinibacillus capsici]
MEAFSYVEKEVEQSANTVTQEQIDNIIEQSSFEVFHRVHEKQCLVVAKLPNGFTVVGESACVDPANYDEQIGYDLAVKHIKNRLWELEGYALQNKLYQLN